MQVRDMMSKDLETLRVDDSYPDVDVLLRLRRVRHLPVIDDDGRLVGLVTHRDLLGAQAKCLSVEQMMTEDVTTCAPETLVLDAARTMLDNRFGCLPVVEDERLVGIITEADFLRWAVEQLSSAG
jgi:CBS domain-containing membrane protein